ncbi:hypothetical protein [Actinomadura gamaensis]|uniref:DNA-directed RNA polymerase specialized sigma24 family protein n=1 Tax=Actinomadura gamaensis TaxID=1763541 RepID=A0ABV9U036_9ACTN
MDRHDRVVLAHWIVGRARPRRDRRGDAEAIYAGLRGRVLREALRAAGQIEERGPRAGRIRSMAWLRTHPFAADGDTAPLAALAALTPPVRAAYALLRLEDLPEDAARAELTALDVPEPDGAVAQAAAVPPLGEAASRALDPTVVRLHARRSYRPLALMPRPGRVAFGIATAATATAATAATLVLLGGGPSLDGFGLPWGPAAEPRSDRVTMASADGWRRTANPDLGTWPARGDLIGDRALIAEAVQAWQSTSPAGGGVDKPQLLFAGTVDQRRIVLLHAGDVVARYADRRLEVFPVEQPQPSGASPLKLAPGRYLLPPWVTGVRAADLASGGSGDAASWTPVPIHDGMATTVRQPTQGGRGGCWRGPVLELAQQHVPPGHPYTVVDLGGLVSANLLYEPPPPAQPWPHQVGTAPDALPAGFALWRRLACSAAAPDTLNQSGRAVTPDTPNQHGFGNAGPNAADQHGPGDSAPGSPGQHDPNGTAPGAGAQPGRGGAVPGVPAHHGPGGAGPLVQPGPGGTGPNTFDQHSPGGAGSNTSDQHGHVDANSNAFVQRAPGGAGPGTAGSPGRTGAGSGSPAQRSTGGTTSTAPGQPDPGTARPSAFDQFGASSVHPGTFDQTAAASVHPGAFDQFGATSARSGVSDQFGATSARSGVSDQFGATSARSGAFDQTAATDARLATFVPLGGSVRPDAFVQPGAGSVRPDTFVQPAAGGVRAGAFDQHGPGDVVSATAWEFWTGPLPDGAGPGRWVCARYAYMGGRSATYVALLDAAHTLVAGHRVDSDDCTPARRDLAGATWWRSPKGRWYYLAAASRRVTVLAADGPFEHTTASDDFLAGRGPVTASPPSGRIVVTARALDRTPVPVYRRTGG